MAITDWPVDERPREKLLQRGASALSDAELLAIFLRTGVRGQSAVDLARALLQKFGSLRRLLDADRHTFCEAHGLGTAKYVQLQATVEMAKRHLQEALHQADAFTSPELAQSYLMARLAQHQREVFACLFLDQRHRLIQYEELFHGTINQANVYPREVVKRALAHNAAAIILAHNHPSGVAEPSRADIELTHRLQEALHLIDVRVLDHIVVGTGQATSMTAHQLLKSI